MQHKVIFVYLPFLFITHAYCMEVQHAAQSSVKQTSSQKNTFHFNDLPLELQQRISSKLDTKTICMLLDMRNIAVRRMLTKWLDQPASTTLKQNVINEIQRNKQQKIRVEAQQEALKELNTLLCKACCWAGWGGFSLTEKVASIIFFANQLNNKAAWDEHSLQAGSVISVALFTITVTSEAMGLLRQACCSRCSQKCCDIFDVKIQDDNVKTSRFMRAASAPISIFRSLHLFEKYWRKRKDVVEKFENPIEAWDA